MNWVITVALAGILVPNTVKLLSVSVQVISFMPMYLQSVTSDPSLLENQETRSRLQNAFTTIFFSIQTHGMNVLVLLVLAWSLWHGVTLNISGLLKGILLAIGLAAGISNLIVARSQIQEFFSVAKSSRAIEQLVTNLGQQQPSLGFSPTATVQVWAWIAMYIFSSVACAALMYLVWL